MHRFLKTKIFYPHFGNISKRYMLQILNVFYKIEVRMEYKNSCQWPWYPWLDAAQHSRLHFHKLKKNLYWKDWLPKTKVGYFIRTLDANNSYLGETKGSFLQLNLSCSTRKFCYLFGENGRLLTTSYLQERRPRILKNTECNSTNWKK